VGRGDPAAHRADVDDAALPALLAAQQRGQQRLGDGDVAEQVDLEQASPLAHGQRLDRGVDGDPGVVHQGPQAGADTGPQGVDVVGLGDVEYHRLDAGGAQGRRVAVAPDPGQHLETAAGQLAGGGRADPRGRAGHHDQLTRFM
jgi:hypothetical protein